MESHNEEAARFSRAQYMECKIQRFVVVPPRFIGFVAFLAQ